MDRQEPAERHVQAIWFDPHLRPARLFTDKGEEVRVIDPGAWNLEAGPDFKDAILEFGEDGRIVAGDAEVHIHPSGWTQHGHAADPRYARVMFHVVWHEAERPRDLPQEVETIPLAAAYGPFHAGMIDLDAYPYAVPPPVAGACAERFAAMDLDAKHAFLENAARRRLAAKAAAFAGRLRAGEAPEEVFWRAFLEAMGWKANTANFARLAKILPCSELPENPAAALVRLHGAAMLVNWNIAGSRPANRPEARFGAIARIGSKIKSFIDTLASCDWTSRAGVKKAVSAICGDGEELPFPARLGVQRASAVAANVAWPFLKAAGRAGEIAWLPPEDESSTVREAAHRLFGRDASPAAWRGNGLWMQGLIAVAKTHCAAFRPSCAACPLALRRSAAQCA